MTDFLIKTSTTTTTTTTTIKAFALRVKDEMLVKMAAVLFTRKLVVSDRIGLRNPLNIPLLLPLFQNNQEQT